MMDLSFQDALRRFIAQPFQARMEDGNILRGTIVGLVYELNEWWLVLDIPPTYRWLFTDDDQDRAVTDPRVFVPISHILRSVEDQAFLIGKEILP